MSVSQLAGVFLVSFPPRLVSIETATSDEALRAALGVLRAHYKREIEKIGVLLEHPNSAFALKMKRSWPFLLRNSSSRGEAFGDLIDFLLIEMKHFNP